MTERSTDSRPERVVEYLRVQWDLNVSLATAEEVLKHLVEDEAFPEDDIHCEIRGRDATNALPGNRDRDDR